MSDSKDEKVDNTKEIKKEKDEQITNFDCNLKVTGKHLPKMDTTILGLVEGESDQESDPYLKVSTTDDRVLGRSLTLDKNSNPQWPPFQIHDVPDRQTKLVFEVYDDDYPLNDDLIGKFEKSLSKIKTDQSYPLKNEKLMESAGSLIFEKIDFQEVDNTKAIKKEKDAQITSFRCNLKVTGKNLAQMDTTMFGYMSGESDPYLKISTTDDRVLGRSLALEDKSNPQWPPFMIHDVPDRQTKLVFEVYDEDYGGYDNFIGKFENSLSQIETGQSYRLKNKEGMDSGALIFEKIDFPDSPAQA